MGGHDSYGKDLLSRVFGPRFDRGAPGRSVIVGGIEIRLDGIIIGAESGQIECAVEVEAENEPQVRGAVLNLFLHPAPKALLLLMPRHMNNPLPRAIAHFQSVWTRLTGSARGDLPIVCLKGDGNTPAWAEDEARLRRELSALGFSLKLP